MNEKTVAYLKDQIEVLKEQLAELEDKPRYLQLSSLAYRTRNVARAANNWMLEFRQENKYVTRWDLMSDADREFYEDVPSPGRPDCSDCGANISTEGQFWRHFLILDPRLSNLGECPVSLGIKPLYNDAEGDDGKN